MNFIIWLVVGGLIGWVASMIMKTDGQQGLILNVIVGIVGAWLAGWFISPLLGIGTINAEQLQHRQPARLAGRRGHPAGDREPVPTRPSPLKPMPRPRSRVGAQAHAAAALPRPSVELA